MDRPILLFDGVCSFCSATVRFVLEHERDAEVLFAARQSPRGKKLLEEHGIDPGRIDSLVLISEGRALVRSQAALALARHLRAPWRWALVLRAIPRPLRDAAYDAFARRRYRLFGKTDACMVPPAGQRERFLDS